jgi:hypothetical protein
MTKDKHLAYTSTLKMCAVSTSETLVSFYQTVRRFMPEDSTFNSYRRESSTLIVFA